MLKWSTIVLLFAVVIRCEGKVGGKLCFPNDFQWGVATAAYQIEGAWNSSGKGESIWDRYTHTHPERVFDHKNGDVADDSYHLFREDVRILKQLGVQFYRFSISWPRILPSGFTNEINEDGLRYYSELIDLLLANNIQPLITMYHWDLPQQLQDLGGWTNPIMADYFVDYARVLFSAFGPKVKAWTTFNEPLTFCQDGYGGNDAPGARSSGLEDYMCAHNVLRAHGMTYRMIEREFPQRKRDVGVGISLDLHWAEPATTSEEDQEAAEIVRQFTFGWYAHPIFSKTGDYPPIMRQRIDDYSRRQHFPRSRLPTFTQEEIDMIKGSADFLGLNHYTSSLVTKGNGKVNLHPSFENDMGQILSQREDWPKSNSTWLRVVPWGFRKTLVWIKNTYKNPPVVVTENGMSLEPGLQDTRRVNYIDAYLRSLHTAITVDKCNVQGYTYWSLLDNFEWMRGYSERFGLYEVDYTSLQRTRTPRYSATFFSKIARTKCIPAQKINLVYKDFKL
ncbi:hypothetical protein O0L34_g9782 [Tuta absoluta]|nr:hypothetical protein O0L34_g9782 [Tuta absoluta]